MNTGEHQNGQNWIGTQAVWLSPRLSCRLPVHGPSPSSCWPSASPVFSTCLTLSPKPSFPLSSPRMLLSTLVALGGSTLVPLDANSLASACQSHGPCCPAHGLTGSSCVSLPCALPNPPNAFLPQDENRPGDLPRGREGPSHAGVFHLGRSDSSFRI